MNKTTPLRLHMQYFAEDGPTPVPPAAPLTPPAPEPGATQPPAATVDIESIVNQAATKAAALAEKKNESVFRSMLEQSGLDTGTINTMVAEFKAKQQTPEQIAAQKDGTIQTLTGENQTLQRQLLAIGKGIPADKSERYIALAQSYLADGVDFDKALDAALVDFPAQGQQKPPPYAPGTGSAPLLGDKAIKDMTYQEELEYKQKYPAEYQLRKKEK